ncbi:MAG: hypothetical protein WCI18_00355 [Pseudomonadota bacterium]
MVLKKLTALAVLPLIYASPSYAIFWSGNGFYSLRAVGLTDPDAFPDTGSYQAIEQHLSLNAEARVNDRASFFLGLNIHPTKNDSGLLGGDSKATTTEPSAKDANVVFSTAYARLGTDYCLIEAGRRPRDWGLGLLYSSAKRPFQYNDSVFDGVTCDVNIQKSQTLGFSIGLDKISEGSRSPSDDVRGVDVDQYFFTIEYDDKLSPSSSPFTKKIGIYVSNITSPSSANLGKTDIKYLDIYGRFTGFKAFSLFSELVFRSGKSKDPSWGSFGAAPDSDATVDSIGLASRLEFILSASGGESADLNSNLQLSKHLIFVEHMRAPGDSDSYYRGQRQGETDRFATITSEQRDTSASGMAFNRNFKPLHILFNGRDSGKNNLPGVYDSDRMVNAAVTAMGYKYESSQSGVFEVKLAKASLLETAPADVKTYWDSVTKSNQSTEKTERADRKIDVKSDVPVGLNSNDLGTELDLTYTFPGSKDLKTSLMGSYLKVGNAFDTSLERSPKSQFLLSAQFDLTF